MRPSIEKLFHLKRLLSSFEVIACACLFSNRSLQVRNFAILSRLPLLRIERHHLHLSALRAKHHDVSIEEPTRDGMRCPSRDEEGRQVGIDSQRHHTTIRAEAPIRAIAVQRTNVSPVVNIPFNRDGSESRDEQIAERALAEVPFVFLLRLHHHAKLIVLHAHPLCFEVGRHAPGFGFGEEFG